MKRWVIALSALALGGCSASSVYGQIDGCLERGAAWNYQSGRCEAAAIARVDLIRVDKSAHLMSVYSQGRLVRSFRVALGRGGLGPKRQQGDGRVPEGRYRITARNPNSAFHLALRIGYPTQAQVSAAAAAGVDPGGDIMIHGLPNGRAWIGSKHVIADWTDGCIAVTNREMDWLYAAVPNDTPIEIRA